MSSKPTATWPGKPWHETNAARYAKPGLGAYVSMDLLAKEGLEAEAKKAQAEAAKGNGIGVPMG